MKVTNHAKRDGARTQSRSRSCMLACAGLTALVLVATPVVAEEDGASGAVENGMGNAGDSTKRGLTRAGEAVGGALDTAISKTGKGVSRALESTGNGIQRAGRAISGEPDPEPPAVEHAPVDPVPEHPIQEESLDE
jgi:hypothetical protein